MADHAPDHTTGAYVSSLQTLLWAYSTGRDVSGVRHTQASTVQEGECVVWCAVVCDVSGCAQRCEAGVCGRTCGQAFSHAQPFIQALSWWDGAVCGRAGVQGRGGTVQVRRLYVQWGVSQHARPGQCQSTESTPFLQNVQQK